MLKQVKIKKIKIVIFISFLIFFSYNMNLFCEKKWVQFDKYSHDKLNKVNVLDYQKNNRIILNYKFPGFFVSDIKRKNKDFSKLFFDRGGFLMEEGKPQVPVLRKFIPLPEGKNISIKILKSEKVYLKNYNVYPVQKPLIDQQFSDEFIYNAATYSKDNFFPGKIYDISNPVIIRGKRMIILTVYPVQFNPVKKLLEVYKSIKIEINFKGINTINSKSPIKHKLSKIYTSYADKALIDDLDKEEILKPVNLYKNLVETPFTAGNRAELLIIAADNYYSNMYEFAMWKHKSGIETKVVRLSDVGSDPSSIKSYIQNAYNTWDIPLKFVLLVGDVDDIPIHYGMTHPYHGTSTPNDLFYSTVDGTDYFPDVHIGRLPVNNDDELNGILNKIMEYEINPDMSDTGWFNRACMASYKQAGRIFHETSESNAVLLESHGYTVDRVYSWLGGSTSDIINSFDTGIIFANYRGHGSQTAWGSPSFNVSDITSLVNNHHYPIMFSITCLSGYVDYTSDCFCEAILKPEFKAASSAIGSTRVSYSFYNDTLDRGFFWSIYDDKLSTLGEVMDRAKLYMFAEFGDGQITELEYNMFIIFGDPSLKVRDDIPEQITVVHPSAVNIGNTIVNINVSASGSPVSNASVCLYKDNDVYARTLTDNSGDVSIPLSTTSVGTLYVTVSGKNLIPYQGHSIIISEDTYVSLYSHEKDDDSTLPSIGDGDGYCEPGETIEMQIVLKNYGNQAATNVNAVLSTTNSYITIDNSTNSFGNIMSNCIVTNSDNFVFSIAPLCPNHTLVLFQLTISDDNGNNWTNLLSCDVRYANDINGYVLEEGTSSPIEGATVYYKGPATGTINLSTSNYYNINGLEAGIYKLSASCPGYVTSETQIVILPPDQSVDLYLGLPSIQIIPDHYNVTIYQDQNTNQIMTINNIGDDPIIFNIEESSIPVESAGLTKNINNENFETIEIHYNNKNDISGNGNPVNENSGGPDDYGYSWIDSDESGGPVYDWIDISSIGTLIASSGDDLNFGPFDLGFNFNFYGNSYNTIRLCINGWLSFTSSEGSYNNYSIPSSSAPENLIAPFWDDLYLRNDAKIYFYSNGDDTAIIMYKNVERYSGSGDYSFQVILKSDGRIIFQYENMTGTLDSATIGMQNNDKTTGFSIAYNTSYIHSNMAIRISKDIISWLSENPLSGTIAPFSSTNIILSYNSSNLTPGDYSAYLNISHDIIGLNSVSVPVDMSVLGIPNIAYYDCEIDDDTIGGSIGDGDDYAEPGETIEMKVRLENIGYEIANNLSAVLSTTDSYVTMIDSTEDFGSISAGETGISIEDYDFTISGACPVGHIINFQLNINDSAFREWIRNFNLKVTNVSYPNISVDSINFNETLVKGTSNSRNLRINNTGTATLSYNISDYETSSAEKSKFVPSEYILKLLEQDKVNPIYSDNTIGDVNNKGKYSIPRITLNDAYLFEGNVKILSWTKYVDMSREYPNTIAALSQFFTDYTLTETDTISAETFESLLNDKDVLLIPELENAGSANAATYGNLFASAISNFVNKGCVVITCGGSYNHYFIEATELASLNYQGAIYSSTTTLEVVKEDCPIAYEVPSTFFSYNASYHYNPVDFTNVVEIQSSGNMVVGYKKIGKGRIIVVGFDYFNYGDNSARLMANSVIWGKRDAEWLSENPLSGLISLDSFADINLLFNASSLDVGTYYANIDIQNNDPDENPVTITVSLNVVDEVLKAVTNFSAVGKNDYIQLQWQNPDMPLFNATMVRFKTNGSYPTDETDGFLVDIFTNTPDSVDNYKHQNINFGVIYYYSAFARYNSGSYANAEEWSRDNAEMNQMSEFIHDPKDSIEANEDLPISVQAKDKDGISKIFLYYQGTDIPIYNKILLNYYGEMDTGYCKYKGTIPAQHRAGELRYYFEIIDNLGSTTIVPSDAPQSFFKTKIAAPHENASIIFNNKIDVYKGEKEATLQISVKKQSVINVKIYSINGRLISNVVDNQVYYPGIYELPLNVKNYNSGLYLILFRFDNEKKIKKFMVIQ